jgi:hypothetical protein
MIIAGHFYLFFVHPPLKLSIFCPTLKADPGGGGILVPGAGIERCAYSCTRAS